MNIRAHRKASCAASRATSILICGLAMSLASCETARLRTEVVGPTYEGKTGDGRIWSSPGVVRVPIEIRSGLPCVRARINDACDIWMIIDTGSQRSVLEGDVASRAGIGKLGESRLIGLGGDEKASLGRIANLQIGGARLSNLPCLIRQQETSVRTGALMERAPVAFNVLGMDAFSGLCTWVAVDYRTHHLELAFNRTYAPKSGAAWKHPLTLRDGVPWLLLQCQTIRWWGLVDTGAGSMLDIESHVATELGLVVAPGGGARIGIGTREPKSAAASRGLAVLPKVEGVGPSLHGVSAVVGPGPPKLGSGLLQQFRIVLDFAAAAVWIEY